MKGTLRTTSLIALTGCLAIALFSLTSAADTGFFNRLLGRPVIITVNVVPAYSNGTNWNDYVKNDGADPYSAGNIACTGSETGYYEVCLHGGERRKVVITGYTTCTGLTITDNLSLWDWTCQMKSSTATFFTIGLKNGKGLADLINSSTNAWNTNNYVTVKLNGNTVAQSPAANWGWTNAIAQLPNNSASGITTLGTAGTIYTLSASRATGGYQITAPRVSIVIPPGVTLSHRNPGSEIKTCVWNTGSTTAPDTVCTVVLPSGTLFAWIEGKITGFRTTTYNDNVIVLASTKFSRLNNVTVTDYNLLGIEVCNSDSNLFRNITIYDFEAGVTFSGGMYIEQDWLGGANPGSDNNRFYNVTIARSKSATVAAGQAIVTNSSLNNIYYNLKFYNLGNNSAMESQSNSDEILTNVLIANTDDDGTNTSGFHSYQSNGITMHHATVTNGSISNLSIQEGSGHTLNQIVAANAGPTGSDIWLNTPSNIKLSQIAALDGAWASIGEQFITNGDFNYNIVVGGTSVPCSIGAGNTNLGMNSSCTAQSPSLSANWITGKTSTSSFVGKVTTNDTTNTSDSNGAQTVGSISDWTNFDNWFRTWGKDGSAYPNSDNTGGCTSGTCRIWDWRLKSTDTVLKNTSQNGPGGLPNGAFTAGLNCPAAVNGNITVTDGQTTPHTFLANAVEVVGDDIGNDNGLCESGEACIYSPNFGVYQGDGNYLTNGTCNFQTSGGSVSGVTMYGYPNNGI